MPVQGRPESIILGVDTSLRSSGLGVLRTDGLNHRAVQYGTLKNPRSRSVSACLGHIAEGIEQWIQDAQPDAVAIEGIFFCRNVKTAIMLGQARGVVISVCARAQLPVYEYSPRSVKKGIVGVGSATKDQVGQIVKTLLALPEQPEEDAADALAIALCHAHQIRFTGELSPKPI